MTAMHRMGEIPLDRDTIIALEVTAIVMTMAVFFAVTMAMLIIAILGGINLRNIW